MNDNYKEYELQDSEETLQRLRQGNESLDDELEDLLDFDNFGMFFDKDNPKP